jgi:hypothetical protein
VASTREILDAQGHYGRDEEKRAMLELIVVEGKDNRPHAKERDRTFHRVLFIELHRSPYQCEMFALMSSKKV